MSARNLCLNLILTTLPLAAFAGEGLVAPAAETLWPQWHARIALQTTVVAPLGLSSLLEGGTPQRQWQGGSVLGDYYFARPAYGNFRASGGLVIGALGGAPVFTTDAGPRLGLTMQAGGGGVPVFADSPLAYLGFGYSGALWRNALSITADVGMVAEHPAGANGVGRALLGNQGMESALREMRLSPMFQFGVRYTF
jgi:hypothetical protein